MLAEQSNNYIFDKRADQAIFLYLPIALILIYLMPEKIVWTALLYVFILDIYHTLWTYIRSDFKEKLSTDLKFRKLFFVLLVCTATALFISYYGWGVLGLLALMKYAAIFHFAKQQYGWLRIINRNLGLATPIKKISEGFSIIYCLAPILIAHSSLYHFSWRDPVANSFVLKDNYAQVLLWIYLIACTGYLVFEVVQHLKSKIPVNITRLSIIFFTFVGWNLAIISEFRGMTALAFFVVGNHVLSYMYLVYRYNIKNLQQTKPNFLKAALVVFALMWLVIFLRNSVEGLSPHGAISYSFDFSAEGKKLFGYLVPLVWLPAALHFILDGFIWKGLKFK